MKVFHPPNAMFPSWWQHSLTFKQCAISLGTQTCFSQIHNPCTLAASPQKMFTLPPKIPIARGHLPSVRTFPLPSRALLFRIKFLKSFWSEKPLFKKRRPNTPQTLFWRRASPKLHCPICVTIWRRIFKRNKVGVSADVDCPINKMSKIMYFGGCH